MSAKRDQHQKTVTDAPLLYVGDDFVHTDVMTACLLRVPYSVESVTTAVAGMVVGETIAPALVSQGPLRRGARTPRNAPEIAYLPGSSGNSGSKIPGVVSQCFDRRHQRLRFALGHPDIAKHLFVECDGGVLDR
jgi:hypothetical protein